MNWGFEPDAGGQIERYARLTCTTRHSALSIQGGPLVADVDAEVAWPRWDQGAVSR